MTPTISETFSAEQIKDAKTILEAFDKLPEDKKPILMVAMNALMSIILLAI